MVKKDSKKDSKKENVLLKELGAQKNTLGDVYYELATAYVRQELYSKAIDAYELAIQHTSMHPDAYYHLGLLYEYEGKNSRKALHYLKKCLALDLGSAIRRNVETLIEVIGAK